MHTHRNQRSPTSNSSKGIPNHPLRAPPGKQQMRIFHFEAKLFYILKAKPASLLSPKEIPISSCILYLLARTTFSTIVRRCFSTRSFCCLLLRHLRRFATGAAKKGRKNKGHFFCLAASWSCVNSSIAGIRDGLCCGCPGALR